MECKAAQSVSDMNATNSHLDCDVNEVHNSIHCEQSSECEVITFECTMSSKTFQCQSALTKHTAVHSAHVDLTLTKHTAVHSAHVDLTLTKHTAVHSADVDLTLTKHTAVHSAHVDLTLTKHTAVHSADVDLTCSEEQLTSELMIKDEHEECSEDEHVMQGECIHDYYEFQYFL
jgi:hypothetical protein